MVNSIVVFILGLFGGSLATYFGVRAVWVGRLKATRQMLFNQYDSELKVEQQQRRRLEGQMEAREGDWLKWKATSASRALDLVKQIEEEERNRRQLQANYEARLDNAKQAYQRSQIDYEAQLEREKGDRLRLQNEYHHYKLEARANVDESLKESEAVEQRNQRLNELNQQIENKKNALEATLHQEREEHQQQLAQAYREADIDLGKLISELFPKVTLVRDSLNEINKNKVDAVIILCRLQALDKRDFAYSKKIHATSNGWSECRAPHMKLLRIYYRKQKAESSLCEVLVSYKKDSKTQDKDLAWLKMQPK
ncbi:MAG: hypothetical protein WBA76_18495 [Phormidesmis sp.]